jgi:hypothetical protein
MLGAGAIGLLLCAIAFALYWVWDARKRRKLLADNPVWKNWETKLQL